MSETKFTPGPWVNVTRYIESEKEHGIVNDGWRIAECMGSDGDANAHLIAAAPELYEALRCLVYESTNPEVEKYVAVNVLAQAEAALAKARGEV